MTKTFFQPGTVVTSQFLNSLQNLDFSASPDEDGLYPLITDSKLSTADGDILERWSRWIDQFKFLGKDPSQVGVNAGNTRVLFRGGNAVSTRGSLVQLTGPSDTFGVIVANGNTYNAYINNSGFTVAPLNNGVPTAAIRLHTFSVSSGGSLVVLDKDYRDYIQYRVIPNPSLITVFGRQSDTDITAVNGQVLSGEIVCRNFRIPAGVTCYFSNGTKINCSGTFEVSANFIGIPSQTGAAPSNIGVSPTGNILIGGFAGVGESPGRAFVVPEPYAYQSLRGSGGGSGRLSLDNGQAFIAGGGSAGASLVVEAALAVTITGTIDAEGSAGETANQSFSKSTGFAIRSSGGSGGSGGLVWIRSATSITLSSAGTIDVRGGDGGASYQENVTGGVNGAGGGGGGYCVLESPSNTVAGNVLLSGGSAGNTIAGSAPLGASSGGAFGGSGGSGSNIGDKNGSAGQLIVLTRLPV